MITIGVLMYEGAQHAAILGLTDLFTVANTRVAAHSHRSHEPALRVLHLRCAADSSSPECVMDTYPEAKAPSFAAIVLPPALEGPPTIDHRMAKLVNWLRTQHQHGVLLAAVCAGAFLLAATGIVNGRRMTTHWSQAQHLRQQYPDMMVDADQLIIDDGDVISAGGLMAWTDLGLRLVDRFLGLVIMMETATMLLVDPAGREQRFYSVFSPNLNHGDAAVLKVQHWLEATQAQDVSLPRLATEAGLEIRTFLRRFHKAKKMTTTEYCQRLRVGKARELLQFSNLSVNRVAWEVGYSDTGAFRKVFTRIVGLTPGDYRRRFHAVS